MKKLISCVIIGMLTSMTYATTYYVKPSGNDSNNGLSSVNAKATIQAAIDCATDGDTIRVDPGTYSSIRTSNKRITIIGVRGAENTIIDGRFSGRPVVCSLVETSAGVSTNTLIRGFTVCHGSKSSVAGTWYQCIICDNDTHDDGGGAINDALVISCLIKDNYGMNGGSGDGLILKNCTIVNNRVRDSGAVAFGSVLENCIAFGNTGSSEYCDISSWMHDLVRAYSGRFYRENVCNSNPGFVDYEGGDFHLAVDSRCIDVGNNANVMLDEDLEGNPRIANGAADLGAYEYYIDPSAAQVQVTFDPGFQGGETMVRSYVEGGRYGSLPSPVRPGFTLEGWFTAVRGGTQVVRGQDVNPLIHTLYAHWISYVDGQRLALDIGSFGSLGDDGSLIWTPDSSESFSGGSSLRSATISHSQSTFQTLTVSGSGTFSFYWKASSESNYDCLRYFVDGVQRGQISGSTSWMQVSVDLEGEGDHVIKWQYSKDGSVNSGSDCGWIDCVTWTGADPGQPDDPVVPGQQGGLLHRWSLNGNLRDSVTGLEGASVGGVTTDGSSYTLPGGSRGTGYLNLGHAFPTNEPAVTLEIWATQISTKYYSHIFHVGTKPNLCMEWSLATMIGYDELGCPGVNIDNNGFCTHLAPYTLNTEFHISVVIAPQDGGTSRIAYCKRDATTGEILKKCEYTSPSGWGLGILDDDVLCLGHDIGGSSENDANARYNEVRIWNRALTDDELKASVLAGADAVISGAVRHTITFDLNGGGEISSREYEDGDPLGELPVPVRPSYVFMGWFTAAEGGGEVRADTLVVSDMTLYARWVKEGEVMVLSARTRDDDASVLDVVYRVSSTNASVNVRALAFEDGDESFAKVIRPETFLDGTGANLGYAVPANTNLVLSWKVTDDWDVKLARVKFMILVEENFYPVSLDLVTIPANGQNRALTFSTNELGEDVVRDALFWLYANHDEGLSLENGVLKSGDVVLANGAELVHPEAERYVFKSMDFRLLEGAALQYVNETARLELIPQGNRQYAYRQD